MTTVIPPVRRRLVVSTGPQEAFRLWTGEIARWWPMAHYSVYGDGASVAFEDGVLTERGPTGETAVWGTVLNWEPGERLRMTWHPGHPDSRATELEIRFTAVTVQGREDASTLVELVHSGWERLDNADAARAEYDSGWSGVIGRYGRLVQDAPADGGDQVWLVLRHRAGPTAGPEGVFAHRDFAEHAAFLGRLRERGVLVAAGPLSTVGEEPSGASGMTVIKVPAAEVEHYVRLAAKDDVSVVNGLLQVEPLTWTVTVAG